jgi:hypothetical protein
MFNYKEINTIEKTYLNKILNCKVLKVYTIENGFLFEYRLLEKIEYLAIQIKRINDIKPYIAISNENILKKEDTLYFNDIKSIYRIFYLEKDDETERVEIIYKNKNDEINSYYLTVDKKVETLFDIEKYENIFKFKSEILTDKNQTQLDFSYDDKYFYPKYSIIDEENISNRKKFGVYHLDYPICLGKKIKFEFDEEIGIKVYNLSTYSESMTLADIDVLDAMSKEKKDELIHFFIVAELYINTLYINQDLNEIIFDDDEKIVLLEKKLIEQNWQKKLIYCNGEQGHPSTNEIYLFKKDDKKFIWFWSTENYIDSRAKLKFDDNCNDELNRYFKELELNEFKRIEVWYEDNYEILKYDSIPYLSASFNYESEAIKYIEDKLTNELINQIKYNNNITVKELIEGHWFGGNTYFLKNSKVGFCSKKFVEENAQLILDIYKKNESKVNQKIKKFEEQEIKEKTYRSNSFYRILISGSIAALSQRVLEIDSFSINGFLFFLVVFSLVSYIWTFVFPVYKDLTKDEIERKKHSRKQNFLIFKDYLKKSSLFIVTLFILNFIVNIISYKGGFFDNEFKFRFDIKSAVELKINQEPISSFSIRENNYFLYKQDKNFFLVEQGDKTPKKHLLTLYTKVYMDEIFSSLKDEKDFLNILENISPTVYKEVSIYDFLLKSLWFSNSIKDKYWLSEDIEFYKEKYRDYITKKLAQEKRDKYKTLLNKDYKHMNEKELVELIKEIYTFYAFTNDSKYIMDIFLELESRSKEKLEGLNYKTYQFAFFTYFKLLEAKYELNQSIKKYDKNVNFTFEFWDYKASNLDFNANSNIEFIDLRKDEKYLVWYDNFKEIILNENKVYLNQKDGKEILLGTFETPEQKLIKEKITFMIRAINVIEKLYNKLKTS